MITQPKIVDRIRKLLELSRSNNEHEAAQAASRAASLMAEHAITTAMLEVISDDDNGVAGSVESKRIIIGAVLEADAHLKRRIAWRSQIAIAVSRSFDLEIFFCDKVIHAIGREGLEKVDFFK